MNNIDFLPEKYRQQHSVRTVKVWRFSVLFLFSAAVGTTALCQFWLKCAVQNELLEVQPKYADAKVQNDSLTQTREKLKQADELARLYLYLDHTWPATQLIAAVVDPMPETISLTDIQIRQERIPGAKASRSKKRDTRRDESDKGKELASASKAYDDLVALNDELDGVQTVIQVAGKTSDSTQIHIYAAKLGASPLFARVDLESQESLDKLMDLSGGQFELRIVVRPGYGRTGGPDKSPETLAAVETRQTKELQN